MQPINYSIDVENPFASAMQGYQSAQASLQQKQQAEAAQEQNAQMQADLTALSQKENPTAQDYARVSTKYPQFAANFKQIWEPLSEEQKQNKISMGTQVLAALKSGNADIAAELLTTQAEALRNSGDEMGAKSTEALAKSAQINPKSIMDSVSLSLAQAMGPEKFSEAYKTLSESSNLATKQTLENQSTFEDIQSKRLKRQIDVLDSQIKSADSEAKREELQLKRDDLNMQREQKLEDRAVKQQEKQSNAQTSLDMLTMSLDSVDRVLKHPELKGDPITRNLRSRVPGSEAVDFKALVDTVKSQQFVANVAKLKASGGTGALSDAEGKKLDSLIANLDINQSNESLANSLGQIRSMLKRAEQRVIGEGNLPTTAAAGGAYIMKHPKYGVITDATINRQLAKNPGMTRERAIQFFRNSGGK